ncbi:phage holin family protein [Pyramidobacter piscolens]|uniref:phage holin family protein n=1 Tax=Pyramidobacter piscolens TaxID=638849 RepID=UPI002AB3273A|nr:phage holin family protein [Pyramidobacter piscolens]
MPGEEQHERTLIDIAMTGGVGAMLAMIFQGVRASREHLGEPFDGWRFTVGLVSAGAIGAIVAWGLNELGVSRQLSAIIIAMCGYVGGPLLDIAYTEIQETVKAAFDGLQKWLSEGKWDRHDRE